MSWKAGLIEWRGSALGSARHLLKPMSVRLRQVFGFRSCLSLRLRGRLVTKIRRVRDSLPGAGAPAHVRVQLARSRLIATVHRRVVYVISGYMYIGLRSDS